MCGQIMLWGDVDEAIKAERLLRVQRIERLSTICALFCLSGAIWLAWPVLKDAFVGDASLLTGLGMPVLVLLWGIVIQDLILDDPRARTRIGAATSIVWPVLLMFLSTMPLHVHIEIHQASLDSPTTYHVLQVN